MLLKESIALQQLATWLRSYPGRALQPNVQPASGFPKRIRYRAPRPAPSHQATDLLPAYKLPPSSDLPCSRRTWRAGCLQVAAREGLAGFGAMLERLRARRFVLPERCYPRALLQLQVGKLQTPHTGKTVRRWPRAIQRRYSAACAGCTC